MCVPIFSKDCTYCSDSGKCVYQYFNKGVAIVLIMVRGCVPVFQLGCGYNSDNDKCVCVCVCVCVPVFQQGCGNTCDDSDMH